MSFAAAALLLGHVVFNGTAQEVNAAGRPDEGVAAHLFQILMGGQALIVLFFLSKWLPKMPREALQILTLQICVGIVPFALLWYFEHQ